ncbi:MAG: capsular biosynthesis protein, partial [Pseudorhodobacter sp.]|nr:capsular biosynthesis protein [Pseudorhodobacter sp.]
MILYPAEWTAAKEAVFTALARADGGGRRLWTIPWSWRGFPQTEARVALCLSRAKRQPQGVARWLKTWLIRLQYNGARRLFLRNPGAVAVAWNGLGGSRQAFLLAARDAGVATLHAELAPFPGRITLDPVGVNAESSVAPPASRRSDVGQVQGAPTGRYLFCPLQVP